MAGNLFSRDGAPASSRLFDEIPGPDSIVPPVVALPDSIVADSTLAPVDSLFKVRDSLAAVLPTLAPDTVKPKRPSRIRREKVDLDNQVVFNSKDSMVMKGRNTVFMYGEASVDYGDLKLNAAEIKLNMDSSEVYAVGRQDSVGEMVGQPVFEEGGSSYESSTMRYNFKSKRGYITDVITQQGEGYLTGGRTKKTEGEDYYLQSGRYTTCDDHECPHFYLQLTRAKVRPKKNIVTGPAYMVLAGLPLPLAIPFGYFPFSDSYASGVIVPTFGDDYNRGFYLSHCMFTGAFMGMACQDLAGDGCHADFDFFEYRELEG